MVADLYRAWAFELEQVEDYKRADEVYMIGLNCRAEPREELDYAHKYAMGPQNMIPSFYNNLLIFCFCVLETSSWLLLEKHLDAMMTEMKFH